MVLPLARSFYRLLSRSLVAVYLGLMTFGKDSQEVRGGKTQQATVNLTE